MLLIFTLFLTVVNASVLSNMFSNPQSFAQTFQNADPVVINKVLSMINKLIDENNAAGEKARKDYAEAVDERKQAEKELEVARKDRVFKEGELKISKENQVTATDFKKLKDEEEANALTALEFAKLRHENKKKFLTAEETRIDNEKVVLEEVLTILNDLDTDNTGRRLLSVDAKVFLASLLKQGLNVDPSALNDVIDAVKALITKGEELRAAAIQGESDAADAVVQAQDAYTAAQSATADAARKLEVAEEAVSKYTGLVLEARRVYKDRLAAKKLADEKEADLLAVKDSEELRVAQENKNFERVKDVLKELL